MSPAASASAPGAIAWRIARTALATRLAMWLWGLLAHHTFGTYDDSMSTLPPPTLPLDAAVAAVIRPFAHWDTVHFTAIAQHGYQFEKQFAFFPFVPYFMRAAAALLTALFPSWISPYYAMVVAGFAGANAAFVVAAVVFFHLSHTVLRNTALAQVFFVSLFPPSNTRTSFVGVSCFCLFFNRCGVPVMGAARGAAVLLLARRRRVFGHLHGTILCPVLLYGPAVLGSGSV